MSNIEKKATTIGEQIARLKERKMIITNEEKAKENLLDIGTDWGFIGIRLKKTTKRTLFEQTHNSITP